MATAARGSEDGERLGFGKEAYRLSQNVEEESDATTLAHLLETNFSTFSLLLPIQSVLRKLLELLSSATHHL